MLDSLIDVCEGFSIYTIPPFLGLLTTLGLALLALIKGRGRKTNLLFAGLCIIGTFLNIDVMLMTIVPREELALKISRYDHILVVYNIPIYLHFIYTLLSVKKRKWLIPATYLFSFILMFFTQSQYYLVGTHRYYFGFFAKGGPLFYLFISINSIVFLYCLYLFVEKMGEEMTPVSRNKINYAFLGFGIQVILALLDAVPISGVEMYPPGNFGFVPMIILAYGVLKHDLLDMEFLIRKSIIYSSVTGLLTGLYALSIVTFNFVFRRSDASGSLIFSILLFLIIVFIFAPMKEKVQVAVDRIFFKGKYDYHKTIRDVSQAMTSILDIEKIANRIMDTVINSMHVSTVSILLWNGEKESFQVYAAKGKHQRDIKGLMNLNKGSPLSTVLLEQKREVFRHNIEEGDVDIGNRAYCLKELDSLHASLVVPMVFEGSVKGVISLGYKKSGDLYTSEDLELLQTLANQSSISMENARSYAIIQELNRNLEKKVYTRTRELEAALLEKERSQEQLIRSESLAAVGQLVAGVAHELNNPIASVSSLVQSTVESLEERDNKEEYEEEIIDDLQFTLKELTRAKEIVRSLLDISRQTHNYEESINMNTVVKDSLRVLYNQYKKYDQDIVEDFQEDLPEIKGNFANLGQVSLNIIKNSIEEVRDNGGKITLKTRFDKRTDRVIFECLDTGKGIAQAIIRDIFKPFFTTKEVGKGTGLGLYISHEIVKRHNGGIFVYSEPGKGTTFRVELPAT